MIIASFNGSYGSSCICTSASSNCNLNSLDCISIECWSLSRSTISGAYLLPAEYVWVAWYWYISCSATNYWCCKHKSSRHGWRSSPKSSSFDLQSLSIHSQRHGAPGHCITPFSYYLGYLYDWGRFCLSRDLFCRALRSLRVLYLVCLFHSC